MLNERAAAPRAKEPRSKPLERIHRQWTTLGQQDPLWAILTRPGKESGKWNPDEFFETGLKEIEETVQTAINRVAPFNLQCAVDFGCGVGRLSQALARHFDRVIGIDVSGPMIETANRLNRFPGSCEYIHNVAPDLSVLADSSADLVYSNITLQHMSPSLSSRYIRDFFRIVRPGGQVIFQLPSRPRSRLRFWAKRSLPTPLTNLLWKLRTGSPEAMESYYVPEKRIHALVRQCGGNVILVQPDREGPPGWDSRKYFCVRSS